MDKILAPGRVDLVIRSAEWSDARLNGQRLIHFSLWHPETQKYLEAWGTVKKMDKFTQEKVSSVGLDVLQGLRCIGCHVRVSTEDRLMVNDIVLPEIVLSHEIQRADNVFLLENQEAA